MLKKNDFVEIDFIARVKETNNIFDTTLPDEAEKAGLLQDKKEKERFKPIKICIGQAIILPGLDNALEGKEVGKWDEIELKPAEAFGERDLKLVKIIPIGVFRKKGIMPQAGMMLTLDGMLVRIAAVSSGRVIADFNNPLSGKAVIYKFKINKKFDDEKEKLEILTSLLLGKPEKVSIENGKGIVEFKINVPDTIKEEFSKKVKEILKIDVEVIKANKEIKESKEGNSEVKKTKK